MGVRRPSHVDVVCWGTCALGVGYLALCIWGRFLSAWPLEWMEGASAANAQRLMRGLPVYAAPSAEHIPFVYPPLGYVPMALGLQLSRGALWGARLSSVVAIGASLWALMRAGCRARKLTTTRGHAHAEQQPCSPRSAGLLAAGLFALGYGYTGGFIDLARIDAWLIALCLWGVERSCAGRPVQGLWLLALACFVKQHALLLLAAASISLVMLEGRRALRGVLAVWAVLVGSCLALNLATGGWFWTYCISVPAQHGLEARLLLSFLLVDVCVYLPVLTGLALYTCLSRRDPYTRQLWLLLSAAVLASALGRAHPGGDDNVRLPAYALLTLLASLGFCELWARLPRAGGKLLLAAALLFQLGMLLQPPALYWPSSQTNATFAQLSKELRRCAGSGDAVAMDHVGLAGRLFAHTLALSDLRMSRDVHNALGTRATQAVLDGLRAPTRPTAFAISASFGALRQVLTEHYELCARVPPLRMPTGYPLARTYVYRSRSSEGETSH